MKTSKIKGRVKYNKSIVFIKAHIMYKNKRFKTFGECLSLSWSIEKKNALTFNKLYKEHYNYFFRYISSKINNSEVAMELNQDLFIKMNDLLPDFNPQKANIKTYTAYICNNMIKDYYRLNNKRINNTEHISNYVDEAGNEFFTLPVEDKVNSNNDISLTINQAINNINNPKLKSVANLYILEQQKYNEIADYLNIPLGSVKGYINRIKKLLQADLKELMFA